LGAVVSAAERIAVQVIVADGASALEWTQWKLDVKDEEGTRLFFYPFEEVSLHHVSEAGAGIRQRKQR
jgi:hypothetical protein